MGMFSLNLQKISIKKRNRKTKNKKANWLLLAIAARRGAAIKRSCRVSIHECTGLSFHGIVVDPGDVHPDGETMLLLLPPLHATGLHERQFSGNG